VLILNKVDLVPKEVVVGWLRFLRQSYPTLAFKASTQQQRRGRGVSRFPLVLTVSAAAVGASADALNSSTALGADRLISLLKNYSRSLDIKTSISVGVVGYPNVGKSSLINSLKRSRAVGVSSTPGSLFHSFRRPHKAKPGDCA
jgi:nuclear GTP-binding protein